MKRNSIDAAMKVLRSVGECILPTNLADQLIKSTHGKVDGQSIYLGDLKLFQDGLYRTLFI